MDEDHPVVSGGGQGHPVGAPSEREHWRDMITEGQSFAASGDVPYLHGTVLAGGGKPCPFRIPGDRRDYRGVSTEDMDRLAGAGIEDSGCMIGTPQGQEFSVWAPRHALDFGHVPEVDRGVPTRVYVPNSDPLSDRCARDVLGIGAPRDGSYFVVVPAIHPFAPASHDVPDSHGLV